MLSELTKTFCEFVQIDSPTGHERKFSLYLKNKLEELGCVVKRDKRGNLITKIAGYGEPLLLVAHIDTVEPGVGIVPIVQKGVVRSKHETILGADNKAAVAVVYELIKKIKSSTKKHLSLEILFSVCEEAGVPGTETFDFSSIKSRRGLCMDAAQPVGTIVLDSPYYLRQEIRIKGTPADVSNPKKGVSSIPALIHYLNEIPRKFQTRHTIHNIGSIKGGYGTNAILDNIVINSEIRSFKISELEKHAQIAADLVKFAGQQKGCHVEYSQFLENQGYAFKKTDLWIQSISQAFRQVVPSIRYLRHYWGISDANNLNKRGIVVVNVGSGAKNPHTTNEQIAVNELSNLLKGLEKLIYSKKIL